MMEQHRALAIQWQQKNGLVRRQPPNEYASYRCCWNTQCDGSVRPRWQVCQLCRTLNPQLQMCRNAACSALFLSDDAALCQCGSAAKPASSSPKDIYTAQLITMGRIKTTPAFVNNQDVRLERPLSRRQRVAWDLNHRDESVQAAQRTAESTVSVRALVVSGRTNIFSTRAPEAAGWIFTGADTVAVGPGACIPGVGYVPFRRGPDGRDQYVDFVLHHSSLPEYPVLTPYKPISYPAHRSRTKYSFLVDSAAQINLVTDANRHLLSGVTGSTGGVLGVGGG